MRTLALLGIAAGIVCGTSTLSGPANAGPAYLSPNGSGGNCSLAAPCTDMNSALGVAGIGGEVICVDKGAYSSGVTITQSVTISCGDGWWINLGGTIAISTLAGSEVVIEGAVLDRNGFPNGASLIQYTGQGALHLRRVRITNSPVSNTFGLAFSPTGPAKLFVEDSYFHKLGVSGTDAAIHIRPASGVTADVVIERTRVENNRFGILANGNGGGIIRGVVRDSVIAGNVNNGITVSTPGSNVVLTVDNSTISGNNFGLVATGANAGMLVRRSVINSNTTGLNTASGGVLLSYGDNSVNGNNAGETFTGPVGLK